MKAWMRIASPTATATVITSSTRDATGDFFFFREADIRWGLEEANAIRGPVSEERLADQPRLGNRSPVAAVERVRAIVAHHVVVTPRYGDAGTEVALALATAGDGERARLAVSVAVDEPVADREHVSGQPDHPLDVGLRGLVGLGHLARGGAVLTVAVLPLVGVGTRLRRRGMKDIDVADVRR